jgi:hypothetical protein
MSRAARILVPFALAALLGSACGDDGDEALSEDEFVEQANEICEEGSEELEAAGESLFESGEEPTDEQFADFADTFEESLLAQMDAVDELNGPADLEEALGPILEESREIARDLADQIRDDPTSLFTQQDDPFEEINAQLEELGITACAA